MHNVVTGASVQSPSEPNTLHFVSDDELLFRTRELARHETELTIVTIQHLDEIERRELYDKRGYPSLFEYAVRELHYSRGCAWRRIMVMKLCRAVPGIADKLRSGELNLTTASQLQNAIEKRARKAARNAVRERARVPVSGPVSGPARVPAAGAMSGGAEESASGEVQPARAGVAGIAGVAGAASGSVWVGVGAAAAPAAAGESAAGQAAAAASAAAWSPVGAAATQAAVAESAAGESAAAASAAAAWAPVRAATAQAAVAESAAGESAAVGGSAAAVPLPAGAAATGVTAAVLLAPAQAGIAGAAPAAVPAETEAARAAGNAAFAAPAADAAALTAGAARESAPAPPAAEAPPAWTLDQKVELVDLVANKSARETEKLLAELEPEVGLPRERQRALGGGRYEVRVILDQGSVDTIAKLKGWLSHVNPGFTTGQLLAHLLQQAERRYDPLRERGRTKRGATAPARHAETCKQHLGAPDERGAPGSAPGAVGSKPGSSTCATNAPGAGEGVSATGAARGSVAAGAAAAGAPAPGPAGAGPSGALARGSAPNRRAQPGTSRHTNPVPSPGSEQDRRDTTGSAQNQRAPLVRDRSRERTPYHAAGSADAGLTGPAPSGAGPSGALARGSAQNQRAQPVPGPGIEQDRRDATGSARNQRAPLVRDRSRDRTPQHAAGSADAGCPAPAPAAAGPSVALAAGSAQNRRAQPVPAPGSEQDWRDTNGSAQSQRTQRVPGRSSDRTPHHAAGSADADSPAPSPAAADPSGALADGSAQNRQAQPEPAPGTEQDRRHATVLGAEPASAAGTGPGQRAESARHQRFGAEPAAAAGRERWFSDRHRAAPGGASAAARGRHRSGATITRILTRAPHAAAHFGGGTARGVAEVRWSLLLPGPAHRGDLWLYPPSADRPYRAGGAGRQ